MAVVAGENGRAGAGEPKQKWHIVFSAASEVERCEWLMKLHAAHQKALR
jgi:hypothetical protein